MSENNENKLVPKLRFPNYSENWTVLPVSEMFEVFRGSPLSKIDLEENGTEPCIHYGELFTKYNEVILATYSKTNRKNGFRSVVGDVLMPSSDVTLTGLAKASAIMLDNVILGGDMNILRPQTDINSIFLSYLLNRSKREIIKLVSGTTVKHIYPSQIITCRLPIIKNSDEQQKIAACLSSLDEVIAGESQKLEVLKEHKKGLLQNLFPQQGETVPKLRFKEFEDSGEWVERTLGEVSDNVMYGMNSAAIMFDGENKYIRITDIDDNTRLFSPNPLTSPDGQLDDKYFVNVGDILFARTGASVGKSYLHQKENGKIYFAGFLIRFTIKNANPYFIYLQTLTEKYQKWVSKTSLRSGQPGINAEEFKSYPILISSLPEQQRIASCLSSLDNLINAQSQKIETLKLHKKGLLQGLFPDVNEHNG